MHLCSSLEDCTLARQQDGDFSAPAQTDASPTGHGREFCLSILDNGRKLAEELREVPDPGHKGIFDSLFLWTAFSQLNLLSTK